MTGSIFSHKTYFTNYRSIFLLTFVIILLNVTTASASETEHVKPIITSPAWVFETEGSFEDVKEELLLAIEARGLVISFTSHSAKMFARTAASVGQKKRIYKNGETVFFCKADLSHKMVAADPHALIFCPYSIATYELVANPGKIYLSFTPPQKKIVGYAEIHLLLLDIVSETLDF